MTIELHPIGYVRSPYKKHGDAPRQGRLSDTVSEIIIDPACRDGLYGLEKKKHLYVLSWFDRADRRTLRADRRTLRADRRIRSSMASFPYAHPTALTR